MFEWRDFVWNLVDYRLTALEVELNYMFRRRPRLVRMYGNIFPVALDCRRFRTDPTITESMISDFTKNINMVYSLNSLTLSLSCEENYIFHNTTHIEDTILFYENMLQDLIYIHRCAILFYNTNGLNYVSEKVEEYGDFVMSIGETIIYIDDILDKLNIYLYAGVENSLIADVCIACGYGKEMP